MVQVVKAATRPRYGLDSVPYSDTTSADGDEGIVAHIKAILPTLDLTRTHIVYIRKSNARAEAERANLLRYQERLPALLVEAGVPEELIEILDEDVGISGIYDATHRPGLAKVEARLGDESLSTIWVFNLARISRDPSYVAPTILAQRLANARVKIVHFEHDLPSVLDMATMQGRDQFIARCQQAAKQRLALRSDTLKARQEAFRNGYWSGSPLPIGWILDQPHFEVVKGRRIEIPAMVRVYSPHAAIKRKIMEIAARPEVTGWAQLLRLVEQAGLGAVPPFPPEIRDYMATRSCLKNCVREGEAYDPTQPVRITRAMLYNLLLEPLALGYRLFGSGARAGGKEWQQIEKKYARMTLGASAGLVKPDSLVRDYREFGGIDPALALFDVESEAAQEMFWHLQEKWSEYDAEELRRSNFENCVLKEEGQRRRGRPVGSGTANQWVSLLTCGLHDDDLHLFSYHPGIRPGREHNTPKWICSRDNRVEGADWCIAIGSDRGVDLLTRVLDRHFLSRLGGVLADARDKEGDAPADDRANKIEAVRAEIEGHQKRLRRKRRDLDADMERWEADGWSEEEIDAERGRWVAEEIVPVERALRDARRRLDVLLDTASPDNAASLGAGEMLGILDKILADWPAYPTATKQVLVQALVERVRVIADRSPASDEVWIQVAWRAGATDLLLAWRNPALDKRPFTEEEDGALRRLWASSCTWEEITAALQLGRRYNLVRRRAAELGITGAGRSRAWREAADLASKSYGQLHPEVAYWVREGGAWREEVEGGAAQGRAELPAGVMLPGRVSDWLKVVDAEEATSTPGRQPDRPP